MADSNYTITIEGDGTGAIQAFDQTTAACQSFQGELGSLQTTMTTPYQHAGMFLFSRQVLGLVGLGDVARHAMMAISTGLESVADAAGISATALGPLLLGVGAAILIFEKFKKSHEDAVTASDKLVDADEKNRQATNEVKTALDAYQQSVGSLPPDLQKVQIATENLTAAQTKLYALDLQKNINDTNAAIDKQAAVFQAAINGAAGEAATMDRYAAGSKEATDAATGLTHAQDEQDQATAALKLKLSELTEQMDRYKATGDISPTVQHLKDAAQAADENTKAMEAAGKAAQELSQQVDAAANKMNTAETSLSTKVKELTDQDAAYTQDSWDKKTAAAQRSLDQQLASISTTYGKEHAAAEAYGLDDTALTAQAEAAKAAARKLYQDKSTADTMQFFGLQANMEQQAEQVGINTFNGLANGVSSSFAKMVVEGQNMAVNLQKVFQNVAEQFITAVGEMMIKWAAFQAMTGIFGMGAGAAGGGMGGFAGLPGMAPASGGLSVPGFAQGGEFIASNPTLIAVGESGPEKVSIVPSGMSAAGGGDSGGGGTSIGNVQVTVNVIGVNDPRELADQVAPYLIDIIRGRGNLSFVGPNIG